MTVETTARFITDLNEAYPRGQDLIHEGDDHIRLMKAVLKNTVPGFTETVNATSGKLNQLDATFQYESDSVIKVNNALDMTAKRIKNIAPPTEEGDAVTLGFIQGSVMWPVGSIFMTVDSRNPNTIFGFGTWEEFAKGRVIIGTGTSFDDNADSKTFTNEGTGGNYNHTLTTDQIPSHVHAAGELSAESGGKHKHSTDFESGESDGSWNGSDLRARLNNIEYTAETNEAGEHTHTIAGNTAETGGGGKFSLIQPWVACNIWKRTA